MAIGGGGGAMSCAASSSVGGRTGAVASAAEESLETESVIVRLYSVRPRGGPAGVRIIRPAPSETAGRAPWGVTHRVRPREGFIDRSLQLPEPPELSDL